MQWCFAGVVQSFVHVGAILDEILAEAPMSMKRRPIQVKVLAEGGQRLSVCEQKPDGADVTIIGTPFDQRNTASVCGVCFFPCRNVFENKVSAAIYDLVENAFAHALVGSNRCCIFSPHRYIARGFQPPA